MRTGTRRDFLRDSARMMLGGSAAFAAASILGSCGGTGDGALPDDVQLVQRFPQNLVVGQVRLPISLASAGGLVTVGGSVATPDELFAHVVRIDGGRDENILDGLVAARHDAAITTPYWPFRAEIPEPGLYRLVVEGGPSDGAAFQVFARGEIGVPGAGDRLPALDTPTFDDARGVEPVCTRVPEPCPLHAVTLAEALALGKPVALLVGTPAHCSTGTCTPALDAMIAAAADGGAATFLHAEVYADADATVVAPTVTALAMNYEPALFVAGPDGIITARLDAVFDATELASVLA